MVLYNNWFAGVWSFPLPLIPYPFFLAMLFLSPVDTTTQAKWLVIRVDGWVAHHILDWLVVFRRVQAANMLQELVFRLPRAASVTAYRGSQVLTEKWMRGDRCTGLRKIPEIDNEDLLTAYQIAYANLRIYSIGETDQLYFRIEAVRSSGRSIRSHPFGISLIESCTMSNIKIRFTTL